MMSPLQRKKAPAQLQKSVDTPQVNAPAAQGPSMAPPAFQLQASPAVAANSPMQLSAEPTIKKGGGTHTIVSGDNLWSLSTKIYGNSRYMKDIKAANPGKNMVIGEVYTMPEIEIPIGTALHDQQSSDKGLRDLAVSIPAAEYEVYRNNLSQEENAKDGEFLQLVDMMRSTGMTMDEMAEDQKSFMEVKAADKGVSVGEYIAGDVKDRGYGGGEATEWGKLTPTEKADYAKRFKAIVKKLETNSPDSVMSVIKEAKKHRGGFIWEPVEVEKNNAFAYTQGDWSLHAGKAFVDAVEKDESIAYANVVHEMGGHNEYGNTQGDVVIFSALDKLPKEEKDKALAGGNAISSAYGYLETEIWAELREDEFDSDKNPTDRPFMSKGNRAPDVKTKLEAIKKAFSPKVAEALVRSLYKRARYDDRITPNAFIKFNIDIEAVFGIKL